ncbi:MAG: 30S ribosome-binding factor RbfA [Firmicutes bacterium]|nr:30S ribosome-binding factor RbfA [Bacillota bacterium]
MARQRAQRVGEAIKEEVSDILQHQLKDPRIGFVSVIQVDVSNDLRHAKVYISVLGEPAQKEETVKAIQKATGFIRSELGQRVRLYHTPELVFLLDESIEHGARIARLLEEVRQEGPGPEGEKSDGVS